jgi:hypothetical protein
MAMEFMIGLDATVNVRNTPVNAMGGMMNHGRSAGC